MCVEIVFFLVTYVCYNFMAAEILPKQRREIIVRGDGNYRIIALWRVDLSPQFNALHSFQTIKLQ